MKKYEVLEQFLKQNKNKWFTYKEINQYVKVSYKYLKLLSEAGFIKITKLNEPMPVSYFSYNENVGKWCLVTKLIKNGKNRNN